jgi:hypothetical protein
MDEFKKGIFWGLVVSSLLWLAIIYLIARVSEEAVAIL